MTLITEHPESGLDVTWLKDNVPLSTAEGKYQTVNKDTSYQLVIPKITTEDADEYKAQSGEMESAVQLNIDG